MARRGNKRIDKFAENCNTVRLQLMYLDDVNDTGHALTKLCHESETYDGDKQIKQLQQMTNFAKDNGMYFQTLAQDNKNMRAIYH